MIVVGVDFSEGSAAAVGFGRDLAARGAGSELQFVHVVPGNADEWRPDGAEEAWLKSVTLGTQDLVLRRGLPWVELVRAVDEGSAVLLVTGTHGATGFQPFRLGTTASKVALRSRAPVVLVLPRPFGDGGNPAAV